MLCECELFTCVAMTDTHQALAPCALLANARLEDLDINKVVGIVKAYTVKLTLRCACSGSFLVAWTRIECSSVLSPQFVLNIFRRMWDVPCLANL